MPPFINILIEPERICASCGGEGHLTSRSRQCPDHRQGVNEQMIELAQLEEGEWLAHGCVKSALLKYTRHENLVGHIENVAIGFSRVRVAIFMILKVLLRANPDVIVPFLASGNRLCKLLHLMNTNPQKRQRALNYFPIDLRQIARQLVDQCQALRYDLSAHSQAVKLVADQICTNLKNHLQVQIPKRLVNYIQSELDRPTAGSVQRLMETSTGGTFAKKQSLEIVKSLPENR